MNTVSTHGPQILSYRFTQRNNTGGTDDSNDCVALDYSFNFSTS